MLAIGRALMAQPRLLLLDEPSLGLAPIIVESIFEVLREVNSSGVSILLVEQNAVEALDIAARNGGGGWSRDRVYELFPRLGERKRNGGAELSGGEQQMLAIGRALLGNPKLLIMDEPSEGLAPTIIDTMVETFKKLEDEGLAILLIEQKLDVATSLATRQLIMVGGEIALETTAKELERDTDMQRRFLGVEPVART